MKELEEVRKQRSVTMQDEATKVEVSQVVFTKYYCDYMIIKRL